MYVLVLSYSVVTSTVLSFVLLAVLLQLSGIVLNAKLKHMLCTYVGYNYVGRHTVLNCGLCCDHGRSICGGVLLFCAAIAAIASRGLCGNLT